MARDVPLTKEQARAAEKAHKLLALANGGATEAEAEAAIAKAQQIMLEHNLSMALIERAGKTAEDGARIKDGRNKSLMFTWKRDLLASVCEANFCMLFIRWERTRSKENIAKGYEVIGRESNVAAVHVMFDYLLNTIERLIVDACGLSPQERYSKWAHSFRVGCAVRLGERLIERKNRQVEEQSRKAREDMARSRHPASAGNALVVVAKDYEEDEKFFNRDLANGWEPGTSKRRHQEFLDKAAERSRRYAERLENLRSKYPGEHDAVLRLLLDGVAPDLDTARKMFDELTRPETERERELRRRREAKSWENYRRRQESLSRKYDRHGVVAGAKAAEEINLDEQIAEDKRRLTK